VTPAEKEAKSVVVNLMIERLVETYSDFITNEKGYDKIPGFFREHLYCPPNKDERDAALEQLYSKLKSVTGPEMTKNIYHLIQLVELTDDLDLATVRVMLKGPLKNKKKISEVPVTIKHLNNAIAKAGRKDDRIKQVAMVAESLNFFYSLAKLPLIKLVLAPIKVAASIVGTTELTETIEAGYLLSKDIDDMKKFTLAFTEREKVTLDRLIPGK